MGNTGLQKVQLAPTSLNNWIRPFFQARKQEKKSDITPKGDMTLEQFTVGWEKAKEQGWCQRPCQDNWSAIIPCSWSPEKVEREPISWLRVTGAPYLVVHPLFKKVLSGVQVFFHGDTLSIELKDDPGKTQ